MEHGQAPEPLPAASPAQVARVLAKRTRPEFIARPGTHRCPHCKRVWPLDHYRPGYAVLHSRRLAARCRTCRYEVGNALRDKARATGLCERRGCHSPHVKNFRCAAHYTPRPERGDLDLQEYKDAARVIPAQTVPSGPPTKRR